MKCNRSDVWRKVTCSLGKMAVMVFHILLIKRCPKNSKNIQEHSATNLFLN